MTRIFQRVKVRRSVEYNIVRKRILPDDKKYSGTRGDIRVFIADMIANHPATLRSGTLTLYQRHA